MCEKERRELVVTCSWVCHGKVDCKKLLQQQGDGH